MEKSDNVRDKPHCIRCLRAIEAFYGGRRELAKLLGIHWGMLNHWVCLGRIKDPQVIVKLSRLSNGRFTFEDLAGINDWTPGEGTGDDVNENDTERRT